MRHRFGFLALLTCVITFVWISPVQSQSYPERPVKILVGFAAGGTVDTITRIYAEKLSAHFNKRFVVENMPGAMGRIATVTAVKAQPDGYTLLMANNANSTEVSLNKKLDYRFPEDFEAIAMLAGLHSALVASPALGVNSVRELIAAAKAKPGEIVYGSAGVGTGTHMVAELYQMSTQTKLTHVPYKALGGAIADLLSGRLSLLFAPLGTVSESIKSGKLKGLAVTTGTRSTLAPNLPTIAESGVPDFDVTLWIGLVAPKGTPLKAVETVGEGVAAAQRGNDLAPRLLAVGGEPISRSFADFYAFMQKDVQTWARVVQDTGVKVE